MFPGFEGDGTRLSGQASFNPEVCSHLCPMSSGPGVKLYRKTWPRTASLQEKPSGLGPDFRFSLFLPPITCRCEPLQSIGFKEFCSEKRVNQIGKSLALCCCPKVYHPKLLTQLKLPKIWKAEAVAMFALLRFSAALQVLEIAGLLTMSAATLCPATCSATVDGSSWPCRYHGNGCKVNVTNTDASRFSA